MAKNRKNPDDIVIASARHQLTIDRVNTTPFTNHAALKTIGSALVISALYVYGWADGIEAAVRVLVSNTEIPAPTLTDAHAPKLLRSITQDLVITILAFGLFSLLRTTPDRKRSAPKAAMAFGIAFIIINFGMAAMLGAGTMLSLTGLQSNEYPHPVIEAGPTTQALYILDGVLAGPTEELVMLALVVVLLRKINLAWAWITLVAMALRIPFHLYYGWASLALSLWVIGIILLYRRTNRIMPIILAHCAKNLIGGLAAFNILPMLALATAVILILGFSMYAVLNYLKKEYQPTPKTPRTWDAP